MQERILSPRLLSRELRRLSRPLAGSLLSAGLLAAAPAAQAQTVYGLGTITSPASPLGRPVGTQLLGSLNTATGTINLLQTIEVTNVTAGQTLVGMDYRPNTGQLFALGYDGSNGNSQLYTLNPMTGVATPVNNTPVVLDLGGDDAVTGLPLERIGFDFNPTVDRIRVVATNNKNYRLNPNNGGISFTDTPLSYQSGTPADPGVGAAAYTNSFIGSTTTRLYDIDELNGGLLSVQSPPNEGVLAAMPAPVAVTFNGGLFNSFGIPRAVDFDIYTNPSTGTETAYLIEVNGNGSSNFYTLNLTTGAATSPGAANVVPSTLGLEVRDIAAAIAAPAPPALTGREVYGVAGGNLITFDSNAPGTIRSAVNITGLPATPAGMVLVGLDFRPAPVADGGGQLYALGYNATIAAGSNNAQLYTLNTTTGALTPVGAGIELALGGAAERIGFDFNPTVDLIRVVSTNNRNYRLSPGTGAIVVTGGADADINNTSTGADVALSAVAYTNNDNNTSSGTALFGYDQVTNQLLRSTNANGGIYQNVGPSGVMATTASGVDLDIFTDNTSGANMAFAAASGVASGFDSFYTVNLGTGAFGLVGGIGMGTNLTAMAVMLTPAAAANVLTWTGMTSTDWGTASNWNPMSVPTQMSNVLIPNVANDPVVSMAQAANNVTLEAGAMLTTANGSTLSVSGTFVNNGGMVTGAGTGTVALNGTAMQTISASGMNTRFRNLTIGASGAMAAGPIAVQSALVLNGNLASNGNLTLLSDPSTTAYVVNTAGSITGSTTIQRAIDPSLNPGVGYRHYSSPVNGSTVGDLATTGFTPVANPAFNSSPTPNTVLPFPNVFGYNQSQVTSGNTAASFDRGWFSPDDLTDPLEVTRGYTVNIDAAAVVDFTGTANNGTVSATGLTRGSFAQSGWHLRGNPYPSPLNWQLMVANGRLTNIDPALYVFKSSGQYAGSYASYVNGAGTNGGSNILPLGQGFFVRTSAAGVTGSITFTNAERVSTADNTPFQRTTADTRPLLTLALGNATARTQATLYCEQGATAAFEPTHDAAFLPGANGLTLASEAGPELAAINGLPALTGQDLTVPLRLLAPATAGPCTLHVDALRHLPAGYHAYLRDALTGSFTDLTAATALPVQPTTAARYAVVFSTQSRVLATAPAELARLASVFPNPAQGRATLLLPQALRAGQATQVQVLDHLGRVVLTRSLAAGTTDALELPLNGLAPGVYSVLAKTALGSISKRLVVQ